MAVVAARHPQGRRADMAPRASFPRGRTERDILLDMLIDA